MKGICNTSPLHIDLSNYLDSIEKLESFFEQHIEWFLGNAIVIAEGPPASINEKQLPVDPTLDYLYGKSSFHKLHQYLFRAPVYVFWFSEQPQKSHILACLWFLFERLKVITVSRCNMQEISHLSHNFSLKKDSALDSSSYVTICLKGEFDSDFLLQDC